MEKCKCSLSYCLTLGLILLTSKTVSAQNIQMSCRQKGYLPQNSYTEMVYNKDFTKVIGDKLVMGPLHYHWSEGTQDLQEVFFTVPDGEIVPSEVEIEYVKEVDSVKLDTKKYQIELVKGQLFKIDNFKFMDLVRKKADRPGVQTYTLLSKDGDFICSSKVFHKVADSYEQDEDL